jgi:hypothetical protein
MPSRPASAKSSGTAQASRFRIPSIPGGHKAVPKNSTYPLPPVRGDSIMTMADIVGADAASEIEASGRLIFHALGDTGRGPHSDEETVAEAMALDIDPEHHANSPAFLLHLGDVIYGDGKIDLYDDEFYRPYKDYPNKVIAIPGNHDAEQGLLVDKKSLEAFMQNFCAPPGTQPPMAQRFGAEMVNQPGVYWMLETRLLNLIGLYSNAAEDFGLLANNAELGVTNIGDKQLKWLAKMLARIQVARANGDRKALIFAMHHPPYARGLQASNFGHPGSSQMLQQMDSLCADAHIMPDAVLSGHTHSYGHYVRRFQHGTTAKTIPYIVAGAGGFAAMAAPAGFGKQDGDVTYVNGAPMPHHPPHFGFGYLTVTVDATQMLLAYTLVSDGERIPFETTTVPLTQG